MPFFRRETARPCCQQSDPTILYIRTILLNVTAVQSEGMSAQSYASCCGGTSTTPIRRRRGFLLHRPYTRQRARIALHGMYTRRAALLMRTPVARRGISRTTWFPFHLSLSLSIQCLRSIRVLRASSPSNRTLRRPLSNISRRQLSLRLHMRANRIRNPPARFRLVCREPHGLEGVLGLLA